MGFIPSEARDLWCNRPEVTGMAFVYIISNKSHRLYVGITTDLVRRVREHREQTYPSSFTARYSFYRLVWFETVKDLRQAAAREKEIKGWRREKKVALIQEMNPNWCDLSLRVDELLCLA